MAARHIGILVPLACLLLASCPSSPPLAEDEIPGDFVFSYEMKVTDEEAFQEAIEAAEARNTAAARQAAKPSPAKEGAEEAPARDRPWTYVFVKITDPGRVEYEVHFGLTNPMKRKGTFDLSEAAFTQIYQFVRKANVFGLKKRYVGDRETGIEETFVVKGNLRWQVIDLKGATEPALTRLFTSVRQVLLDKDSRMFDHPKEHSELFIIDKRNREFHRGDCERLKDIPKEFQVRKDTIVECLNVSGWPCETCRPLEEQ